MKDNKYTSPADKEHQKLVKEHKEIKEHIKTKVFEIFSGISRREIDLAFNKITQELPSNNITSTDELTEQIVALLVDNETKMIHIREGSSAVH
jgi:hypothetical protein